MHTFAPTHLHGLKRLPKFALAHTITPTLVLLGALAFVFSTVLAPEFSSAFSCVVLTIVLLVRLFDFDMSQSQAFPHVIVWGDVGFD